MHPDFKYGQPFAHQSKPRIRDEGGGLKVHVKNMVGQEHRFRSYYGGLGFHHVIALCGHRIDSEQATDYRYRHMTKCKKCEELWEAEKKSQAVVETLSTS